MIRLLFIGDIVGRPGRDLVRRGLSAIVHHQQIDLVIANVENAAAGFGITPDIAEELLECGIQVMTGGNHTWDKKEIVPYFDEQPRLIRPANFPAGAPGRGVYVATSRGGVRVAFILVLVLVLLKVM
jgi:calcineurin-like phosphoesterase